MRAHKRVGEITDVWPGARGLERTPGSYGANHWASTCRQGCSRWLSAGVAWIRRKLAKDVILEGAEVTDPGRVVVNWNGSGGVSRKSSIDGNLPQTLKAITALGRAAICSGQNRVNDAGAGS